MSRSLSNRIKPSLVSILLMASGVFALSQLDVLDQDADVYTLKVGFSIAAKGAANQATEAGFFDTVLVEWANPGDSLDVITRRVPVRPAPRQARCYFSTRSDGSDTTDRFFGNEATLYFVVVDQVLPPGMPAKGSFATKPSSAGSIPDKEVLNLHAIPNSSVLVATLPVDLAGPAVAGDGRLRLSMGDQITGLYQDPMDTESPAVSNAGFGASVSMDAELQFTDKDFNVLPAGIYFSPEAGFLFLRYKDDWVDGTLPNKMAILDIVNNRGFAPADREVVPLSLVPSKRYGAIGLWEGRIPLKDLPVATLNNGTAETLILGEVSAAVTSHDSKGGASDLVMDRLLVARPEKLFLLTIEDSRGPEFPVGPALAGLVVRIEDHNPSSLVDTASVTLRCSQSGDVLTTRIKETGPATGAYLSGEIRIDRSGQSKDDTVLNCMARDILRVKFTHPVYLTGREINLLLDASSGIHGPAPNGMTLGDVRVQGGLIQSRILKSNPPRSIACFDALGVFVGWAKAGQDPGAWRLPKSAGPLLLEIRWRDGSRTRLKAP